MVSKYLRCVSSARFGSHEIVEGSLIGCDGDNPYIQAMLDNGILEEIKFDENQNMETVERVPQMTTIECGLMLEPC